NFRLTAKDNGGGTYLLGGRITGQSTDPFTYGTTALTYGDTHTVVVDAEPGGTLMRIFVDPPGGFDPNTETPYFTDCFAPVSPCTSGHSGTAPTTVGALLLSQFASATVLNVGVSISSAKVTYIPSGALSVNSATGAPNPAEAGESVTLTVIVIPGTSP